MLVYRVCVFPSTVVVAAVRLPAVLGSLMRIVVVMVVVCVRGGVCVCVNHSSVCVYVSAGDVFGIVVRTCLGHFISGKQSRRETNSPRREMWQARRARAGWCSARLDSGTRHLPRSELVSFEFQCVSVFRT